jgi:hypothetical protein
MVNVSLPIFFFLDSAARFAARCSVPLLHEITFPRFLETVAPSFQIAIPICFSKYAFFVADVLSIVSLVVCIFFPIEQINSTAEF